MSAEEARPATRVGGADPELDRQLSEHLDAFNRDATPGVEPARELTVQVRDGDGKLLGGVSGWTWGEAAGMALAWVHPDHRGSGIGRLLLQDFEREAGDRGCLRVFVTSFTFQAPGFYERHGYREILRWDGVPGPGRADVHLRKDLSRL